MRANPTVELLEDRRLLSPGFVEFATPTTASQPDGITLGSDNNLWFTESQGNKLGVIDALTHAILEYPLPPNADPGSIVSGPDGNLWFTEIALSKVGIFSPSSRMMVGEFYLGLNIPRTNTIRIKAGYDSSTSRVTLTFVVNPAFPKRVLLTIVGAAPNGLTDTSATFLDGLGTGQPGTNAVFTIGVGGKSLVRTT